jgi:quinoprotein glucose dehydrogenase
VEALEALFGLDAVKFDSLVSKGMADSEPRVRARTLALTARRDATKARPMVEKALQNGTLWEKQAAVVALGTEKSTNAKALLAPLIDSLKAGSVEPGLALEVAEAAKAQATNPKERSVIDDLEKKGKYRDCLTGGDAEAGRRIYAHKAEVSCVRCHALKGTGGIVGPALDTLAIKKDRNYLLESIVEPNKAIAQGYETVVISLKNGKTITGVLRSGTGGQMKLVTAEGVELTVPLADIDEHERGPSAMPADIVNKLSRRELRDLVEFLASLR